MCDALSDSDARGLRYFFSAELPDCRAHVKVGALDTLPLTTVGAVAYVALSATVR